VSTQHGVSIPVDTLPTRVQRSWSSLPYALLVVANWTSRVNLATYDGWAFAYAGPTSWNSLPDSPRTLILLCKPSNAISRPSYFPHTGTFTAFEVSYKNALYKSTVINTPASQTGRQTGRTERQRSDSIGRTVLQTVAQKINLKCMHI